MATKAVGQITVFDYSDGYSVMLTNPSYTFIGDEDSVRGVQSVTTRVVAMQGASQINASVDTSQIIKPTGFTVTSDGATPSPTLTIQANQSVTNAGVLTIPVTVATGVTVSLQWSYSIAFTGGKGDTGDAGRGVTGTTVQYASGTLPTTPPSSGWQDTVPSVDEGKYLWVKTVFTYSSGDPVTTYSVAKQGERGNTGNGISSTVVEYAESTSGTTPPATIASWGTDIPNVAQGNYLWTRTTTNYTGSNPTVSYSVARIGMDGEPATAYSLIVSHAAITKSASGTFSPTSITLTAKSQTGTGAFANYSGRFKIEVHNGSSWSTKYTSSSNENTKSYTIPSSTTQVRCSLYLAGGTTTLLDQQTIPVVSDGTSVTITSKSVKYQKGTSGTTAPTGIWGDSIPSNIGENEYLWTQTIVNYSDGNSTEAYSVSRNAANGFSPTVSSTTVEYVESTSGTAHPTSGWSTTPPTTMTAGRYMWTKTTVTYDDGNTSESYAVSRNGSNGGDAYTVILDNESHTFAGGTSAAIAGAATVNVYAYKGATAIAPTVTKANISGLPTGMSVQSVTNDSTNKKSTIVFAVTTSMVTRSGMVTIPVVVDGKTFSKEFSYSLALQGTKGDTGDKGDKGDTGDKGDKGDKGEKGDEGFSPTVSITKSGTETTITVTNKDGSVTSKVLDGAKGDVGATAEWYYGSALTHTSGTSTLDTSATSGVVVGSMYLNPDTSLCYKCTAISGTTATWTYAGDLTTGVLENIEIGGRNLWLNTLAPDVSSNAKYPRMKGQEANTEIATANCRVETAEHGIKVIAKTTKRPRLDFGALTEGNGFESGQTYTASFDWSAKLFSSDTTTTERYFGFYIYDNHTGTNAINEACTKRFLRIPADIKGTEQSGRMEFTFTIDEAATVARISIMANADAGNVAEDYFELRNMKLEKGNKATDWTPAPEDVDASITTAQSTADTANALAQAAKDSADGKITTFYQNTTPTALATGDLWINTTNNQNALSRWDGTMWVPVDNAKLEQALQTAATAQATADGKIMTFAQNDAPTGTLGTGDLWVDTDDNNRLYRWNGTTWDEVTDKTNLVPNLTPWFDRPITDTYDATTNPDGYWVHKRGLTQLSDGWAHFEGTNSGTSNALLMRAQGSAVDSVVEGGNYTCLIEFRNVTNAAGIQNFYTQQSNGSQFWGDGSYDGWTIPAAQIIEGAKIYKPMKCVTGPTKAASMRWLMSIASYIKPSQTVSYDFRVSLYEGTYTGPYKPHVDQTLRADVDDAQATADAAQTAANNAQATANQKKQTFISTPTPPYYEGDAYFKTESGESGSAQWYVCTNTRLTAYGTGESWEDDFEPTSYALESSLQSTKTELLEEDKKIKASVEEQKTYTDGKVTPLETRTSTLEQAARDFTLTFNTEISGLKERTENNENDLSSYQKVFAFTENGLQISEQRDKIQTPSVLQIDNGKISFIVDGQEASYWSGENSMFYVGDIVVGLNKKAQFGNFAWIPRSNGNLSFRWVGSAEDNN